MRVQSVWELKNIAEALKNGKVKQHGDSIIFITSKCQVPLNPTTGNLIQVTPK